MPRTDFDELREVLEETFEYFMLYMPKGNDCLETQDLRFANMKYNEKAGILLEIMGAFRSLREAGYPNPEIVELLKKDVIPQILTGKEDWSQRLLD